MNALMWADLELRPKDVHPNAFRTLENYMKLPRQSESLKYFPIHNTAVVELTMLDHGRFFTNRRCSIPGYAIKCTECGKVLSSYYTIDPGAVVNAPTCCSACEYNV